MLTIIALNWSRTFGQQAHSVRFCSKETWQGIALRFLDGFKSCFVNLGSLWAFEGCVLVASYISEQAFASQVVLLQIAIIFLAVPYAFGTLA